MASNMTDLDIDVDVYITGNSVANVLWVVFLVLPALVLCLLCVLAICCSTLNLKIKIVLVDVLASEVTFLCASSVRLLGFLARFRVSTNQVSCSFSTSGGTISSMVRFSGILLYSILV